MNQLNSLCIYCGSGLGNNPRHRDSARRLGQLMAARRITLVYGGARIGLMGTLADAVAAGGGKVIGIIPQHLDQREVGHRGVELHIVDSMHSRKAMMFDRSDAFAILPGGLGTLDEAFEMLTWRQLQLHDKPILFLNIEGYWTAFGTLVDQFIAEGFARESSRRLFAMVCKVEEVIPTLLRQPAPAVPDDVQRL